MIHTSHISIIDDICSIIIEYNSLFYASGLINTPEINEIKRKKSFSALLNFEYTVLDYQISCKYLHVTKHYS